MSGADRELASRLGKFLVVGSSGVVVNNAALYALYHVFRLPLVLASTLAVALAVGNNFVLNDRWTFRDAGDADAPRRLLRFSLVSLGGVVVTTLTLWALVTYLDVQYLVANLIGIGLSTASNFVAHLKWTWSRSSAQ